MSSSSASQAAAQSSVPSGAAYNATAAAALAASHAAAIAAAMNTQTNSAMTFPSPPQFTAVTTVPIRAAGRKRTAIGSIAEALSSAVSKRQRAGAYNYFADHVESTGRDPIIMQQSMVVLTCQLEKGITQKREEDVSTAPTGAIYAPASSTHEVHELKKGNLVFTTHDSLTGISARTTLAAMGTVSVSDNVNNLSAHKKIQFVGCVEKESNSNDGTVDVTCTISTQGAITTINTGHDNMYPGQKCYALPYPNMVDCGNGKRMPYVIPEGQPKDKFLLTTVGLTDDVIFVMLRNAKREVEKLMLQVETQTHAKTHDRVVAFQKEVNAWCVRNRQKYAVADESLLADYCMMYGIKLMLQRYLTKHDKWYTTMTLCYIVILAYRILKMFIRDRGAVVDDFYQSIGIPNTVHDAVAVEASTARQGGAHAPLQILNMKIGDYMWVYTGLDDDGLDEKKWDKDEPERMNRVWIVLKFLDQMLDVAREEIVSFLDRHYAGRVMSFSKPGGSLDLLMGAK
jgi:hypothetical protein